MSAVGTDAGSVVGRVNDIDDSSTAGPGPSPGSVDSPSPSPPASLRTSNKKTDGAADISPSAGGNGIGTTCIRRKLSFGTGRGRSLSFGSAASSPPPSSSAEAATASAAAAPPVMPLSMISAANTDQARESEGSGGKHGPGCDSSVATSSASNRSPTRGGSNNKLRRKCSTTAQQTAMIREAGVENNIRRLVEYFVVVSCTRRQTAKRSSTSGEQSPDQPTPGSDRHVQQPDDANSCPPSPPPAVQCMVALATPTSKSKLRKTTPACDPSPKVQQRMNFRRVHLPGGDVADDTIAADEESSTLRPPDLESASDNGQQMTSSPTGMSRKKFTGPFSPKSRTLFKGKVRSCDAAIEEGSAKLRLPVLDQVESEASTFDDSDCDDDRIDGSSSAALDGLSPLPYLNDIDKEGSAAAAPKRPPLHPTPSQKARWIREGGASNNIRMPGHDSDDSGIDEASDKNGGTTAASVGGAELIFEPQVTSRYPLEDYPNNKLNESAVAQFCNPSSDFIELTTEYQMPRVHHFVLTNEKGRKIYGTCLTIYEEYEPPGDEEDLLPEEREILNWYRSHAGTVQYSDGDTDGDGVEVTLHRNAGIATLYLPRMLCLLSTWPYLAAFREYLTQLYRLATTTDQMNAPLERYILNICKEVPAPPPGAFEVRIDILGSAIRFWAPPANQPIAYVALPFGTLFECLDISNVLFVWYSLTLERKVLLVSSQCSILTVCAEILCSLLFPMQWSHLYIPTIPRFLTPMLDAPMPYLCGITRENMAYAVGDISDETIVVDLDQNVITTGPYTPELPPIPHRRRFKLESALEQHAGEVFWAARGLRRDQVDKVRNSKKSNARERLSDLLDDAEQAWQMRNKGFDDAFNLAHAPDSVSNLDDDQLNSSPSEVGDNKSSDEQSQYDAVQEAFLRFYVAALKGYRKFLAFGDQPTFHSESFVKLQREDFQPFLQELTQTQMFDAFITKRLINPGEPDCIFFDQSIDEKKNRSKLKINKTETPFLQSTKSHRAMKTFHAVKPNVEGIEIGSKCALGNSQIMPPHNSAGQYEYSTWPEMLKPELFGVARPIPQVINAEFDHQSNLVAKIRSNYGSNDGNEDRIWDLYAAESDPSPEVAVFTVFFLLYSSAVGRALESAEEKRKKLNLGLDVYAAPTPTKTPTPTPIANPDSSKEKEENASETIGSVEMEVEELGQKSSSFQYCGDDICCALSDFPGYKDVLSRIATVFKVEESEDGTHVEVASEEEKKTSEDKTTSPQPKLPSPQKKYDRFDQMALFTSELEEARATTIAELDLAFAILSMMGARLLYADPDVYKNLMMACGKCGDAERATELMEVVQEEGLVADSEMHACFVNAFAANRGHSPYLMHDNTAARRHHRSLRHQTPSVVPFLPNRSFSRNRSSEQKRKEFVDNVNLALTMSSGGSHQSDSVLSRGSSIDAGDNIVESLDIPGVEISRSGGSALSSGNQLKDSVAMKRRRSKNKSVSAVETDRLVVTDSVSTHVALGESLLNLLYPDIVIDTNSDTCPRCSKILSEDDITRGWVPCAFKEYTAACPQCQHRFVPKFTVSCSSPTFQGSQGISTPLYCEFVSPWVLRKEIHNVLRYGDGIDVMLQPKWRTVSDINATLWWNTIVWFKRYKLPISFLLQGSFRNRLILPAPAETF